MNRLSWLWTNGMRKLQEEEGISTIEIVLLIVILIALVLMFKSTIVDFVSNVLNKISSQSSVFDPGAIGK